MVYHGWAHAERWCFCVDEAARNMMIELRIKWDGPVQGLAEHRLSVALFSAPLRKLLSAVRRTASNMLREAGNRRETDTGRLAAEADQIDIEIMSLLEGSSGVASMVSVQIPPGQMGLWPKGLAEDATDRLLLDIERESRGIRRNQRARDYLESLPQLLTSHDYWLIVDGDERRHVHIGELSLSTVFDEAPYLMEFAGRIIGVGFSPGPHFVRLKLPDGSDVTLNCDADHVSQALEMHSSDGDVRVLALFSEGTKRLLRIQLSHERRLRLAETEWVFDRWSGVLSRLAQ